MILITNTSNIKIRR